MISGGGGGCFFGSYSNCYGGRGGNAGSPNSNAADGVGNGGCSSMKGFGATYSSGTHTSIYAYI